MRISDWSSDVCSSDLLPASNARALEKARGLASDVVLLDLEDAVAPEMKVAARQAAVAAIAEGGFGARELVVRTNGLDPPWGADDLAAVAGAGPAAVLVPSRSEAYTSELQELTPNSY